MSSPTKLPSIKRPKGINRQVSSEKERRSRTPAERRASAEEAAAAVTASVQALPFPQLRRATRVAKETNDLAWAGRLQPFSVFWWNLFTRASSALLLVSVLCLTLVIWSVFSRHPPLLIGVYPSGSELCFPEMVNHQGVPVPRSSVYSELCGALNARSGAMWVSDPSKVVTDPNAVKSSAPPPAYLTVDQALAQMAHSANSILPESINSPGSLESLPNGPDGLPSSAPIPGVVPGVGGHQ